MILIFCLISLHYVERESEIVLVNKTICILCAFLNKETFSSFIILHTLARDNRKSMSGYETLRGLVNYTLRTV